MTSAIGAVYIEYKVGPNADPCGTPQASLCLDKQSFATLTYLNWFERYERIQAKALPFVIPIQSDPIQSGPFLVLTMTKDLTILIMKDTGVGFILIFKNWPVMVNSFFTLCN